LAVCRKPTTFVWEPLIRDYEAVPTSVSVPDEIHMRNLLPADIDGDGDDDLLWRRDVSPGATDDYDEYVIVKNDGANGFVIAGTIGPLAHVSNALVNDDATIDANGDGAMDLAYRSDNTHWTIRTFSPGPNGTMSTQEVFVDTTASGVNKHYVGDFNGDGWTDFMRAQAPGDLANWSLFSGRPTGFQTLSNTTIFTPYPDTAYVLRTRGDARASLLVSERDNLFSTRMYELEYDERGQLTDNQHLSRSTNLLQFVAFHDPHHYVFVDVNGDGLTDALKVPNPGGDCNVVINTGNGFVDAHACNAPVGFKSVTNGEDPGVRIGDFNDDGRPDLLFMGGGSNAASPITYLAGSGSFDMTHGDSPLVTRETTTCADPNDPSSCTVVSHPNVAVARGMSVAGLGYKFSQVGDFNGDGRSDFVQLEADSSESNSLHVYLHRGKAAGRLREIKDGTGFVTTVDYQPMAGGKEPLHGAPVYTRGTGCQFPQQCVRKGMWLVASYSQDDGIGGKRRFGFTYEDARTDAGGRGWQGFGKRTIEDEARGVTTTITYDNTTMVDSVVPGLPDTIRQRVFPFSGLAKAVTTRRSIGSLRARIEFSSTTYEAFGSPISATAPSIVRPRQIDQGVSEMPDVVGGAPFADTVIQRSRTTLDWDELSNLVDSTRITALVGNDLATGPNEHYHVDFPSTSPAERAFAKTFNLPQQTTLTSTDETGRSVTRTVSFDYFPATNLLRRRVIEPSGPDSVRLAEDYDPYDYGRPTTITQTGALLPLSTVREARTVTMQYDPRLDDVFPVAVINGVGQQTKLGFVTSLGQLGRAEDVNGVGVYFEYDVFGRFRSRTEEKTQSVQTVNYGFWTDLGQVPRGVTSIHSQFPGGGFSFSALDALGREVARTESLADGSGITRQTGYDSLGRVVGLSGPFGGPPDGVRFTWDGLGRLLERRVFDPTSIAVSSATYLNLTTTTTNESGIQRQVILDQLGRVARTSENRPTGGLVESTYGYGPFGRLETITPISDPTNPISMGYDAFNRRTSVKDPDSTERTFEYNPWGQILKEITSDFTKMRHYDRLGRLDKVTATVGSSEETTFLFDGAANGIGKLWKTISSDGVTIEERYDEAGRSARRSWAIDGAGGDVFDVDTVFDAFNRLESIRYPQIGGERFAVRYEFDANGLPENVRDAAAPASSIPLWTMNFRDQAGMARSEQFANGVGTIYTNNPYRGRVDHIDTTLSGQVVQGLDFGYRADGNLMTRTDRVLGAAEQFDYDSMNRLRLWSGSPGGSGSPWSYEYLYDDLGNLRSRTAVVANPAQPDVVYSYGENGAGPHALTSSTLGDQYHYNALGAQTQGPGREVTYTTFDLPRSLTNAAGPTQFKYDGAGTRVVATGPDGTIVTLGDLYERRPNPGGGVLHTLRIPGAERVVAEVRYVEQGGAVTRLPTRYLHVDQLGSIESASDDTGAVEHFRFDPFGKRLNRAALPENGTPPISGEHLGFTSHSHDDAFALINMRGRMYDPQIGRFLSPDPIIAGVHSSALNLYAYAYNNPLRFIDPSGYQNTCDGPSGDPSCAHADDPCYWNPGLCNGDMGSVGQGQGGRSADDQARGNYANYAAYLNGGSWGAGAWGSLVGAAMPGIQAGTCDDRGCGAHTSAAAGSGPSMVMAGILASGLNGTDGHSGGKDSYDFTNSDNLPPREANPIAPGIIIGGGVVAAYYFPAWASSIVARLLLRLAPAAPLVPILGQKLDYFLGRATGSIHNMQRSAQMLLQLKNIGLPDNPVTRQYLTDHLTRVLNDSSNIVKIENSIRVIRESVLAGPDGVLKLQTVWEGSKLITGILFGSP
jgi:RHS repeat-associated protein